MKFKYQVLKGIFDDEEEEMVNEEHGADVENFIRLWNRIFNNRTIIKYEIFNNHSSIKNLNVSVNLLFGIYVCLIYSIRALKSWL